MRSIRTPGGKMDDLLIFSISASTRRIVGMLSAPRRISTIPWTISSSLSCPAMPKRGWLPIVTVATSLTNTGEPLLGASIVLAMSSTEWINPMPRTTAACGPKFTVWPPTLILALFSAASTLGTVRP